MKYFTNIATTVITIFLFWIGASKSLALMSLPSNLTLFAGLLSLIVFAWLAYLCLKIIWEKDVKRCANWLYSRL